MLILKRENAPWTDKARAYKVFIDGAFAGKILDGETKEFVLADGPHSLKLKIDWCSSKTQKFEIRNGETVFASCSPAKKPIIIGELLYITFKFNRYIDLRIG
ncbi:MAG: hypothetical protein E7580_02320 [Ruminococcaceae bacterium]|nr:hypothetical protein [Oscillospiraceae bacterium]